MSSDLRILYAAVTRSSREICRDSGDAEVGREVVVVDVNGERPERPRDEGMSKGGRRTGDREWVAWLRVGEEEA